MKNPIVVFAFLIIFFPVVGQKKDSIPDLSKGNYVITNLAVDSLSFKDRASQTLRLLRNGAVIVRLKTNQKSIDAYKKAGQNNIAEKIAADRQKQNEKMYQAFNRSFLFCKVFFIYASETNSFLEGNRKIFLNESLQHDTGIVFTDTNFVFCEFGSVESYSKFKDYQAPIAGPNGAVYFDKRNNRILDTIPTQTSTAPTTTSGLFFSDKNLKQLYRPFPFVEGVYMENYDAPIRGLSRELEKAYERLVLNKDFKDKLKEEKKKLKEQLKKLK